MQRGTAVYMLLGFVEEPSMDLGSKTSREPGQGAPA